MYKHARGLRVLPARPLVDPPPPLPTGRIPMRAPCPDCTTVLGTVQGRGGQACVYCAACGRWCYNAPARDQRRWSAAREAQALPTRPRWQRRRP